MEGPDALEEEEDVPVHSGLDDFCDHLELQRYIVEMYMRIESLEFDMVMELSAHDELDEILERGLEQEDRKSMVLEVEGVRMDISMEDWEKEVTTIDFKEWLVLEMSGMYSYQLVTRSPGTPSELEGCGGQ